LTYFIGDGLAACQGFKDPTAGSNKENQQVLDIVQGRIITDFANALKKRKKKFVSAFFL